MLEVFKDAEQKAREMSEFATAIALKYQKRMAQVREEKQVQVIATARAIKPTPTVT